MGEDGRPGSEAWDLRGDDLQLEPNFGGMDVSEAKRLKALEEENAKPEQMLDAAALRERLSKNPSRRLWRGKLLILSYSVSLLMFDVREIT